MKSAYVLEMSAPAGAARKGLCWAYAEIEPLKQALAEDLETCLGAWFLLCYGQSIELHSYEQGQKIHSFSLKPFLCLKIAGFPSLSFDAQERLLGYDPILGQDVLLERGQRVFDRLCDQLTNEEIELVRLEADWDAMPIQPLRGEGLSFGETLPENESDPELYWGLTDIENGGAWYRDEEGEWVEYP